MAEDKQHTTPRPQAPTTAPGPYIPEALRSKIEAHHATLARKMREAGKKYRLPADITNAIIADLKDFLRNDYQGLNLDAGGIVYIGSVLPQDFLITDLGDDFAIRTLFDDYGKVAALIRLAYLREDTQEALKPAIKEMLQERLTSCGPLALNEWARYMADYDPDFINEQLLQNAQAARYVDFLVYAGIQFNANAAQLQQVEPPPLVKQRLDADEIRSLLDDVIAGILSAPIQLEHILGLHEEQEGGQDNDQVDDGTNAPLRPTTQAPAATAQEIAETASTLQQRFLVFYQPNLATLAKPIEATKEGVLSAEVVALHALQGYKTARPQPLRQIIEALADRAKISPVRVYQTLQALQFIAQDKPDKIIDLGEAGEFFVYNGYSATKLACQALQTDNPNAREIKEILLAAELITTLRIGHDEDHVIGRSKKTGKDITKRYRHFTQYLQVPDIRVELDQYDQQAGDPHLTLQIHRLIPTGRRSDKQVLEDGQRQTIAAPHLHRISQEELDQARRLFRGDEGIRFYNILKSTGHIKEPDFMAAVFDYQGQLAAAKQRAGQLLEAARKKAAYCNTQAEADAINSDARKQADAITRAAEDAIRKHKPRDRQRLYGWLQDALDNFIIIPEEGRQGLFSDAKDGSTDGRGRPIKVIAWRACNAENM